MAPTDRREAAMKMGSVYANRRARAVSVNRDGSISMYRCGYPIDPASRWPRRHIGRGYDR